MYGEELVYQMALTMIPKIGAITAKKLIAYIGSPEAIFREKETNLQKIPGIGGYLSRQTRLKDVLSKAEQEIRSMEENGIGYHYYRDDGYPWRLKNCDDGPLLLFFRGNGDFNRSKYLSVVGTRSASHYGKEICKKIIHSLGENYPDLVIISGLAYGIDITAHRAALDAGLETFAVLAHGLNTLYPSCHHETARKIRGQGSLVTDFHSDVLPERNNFLRRNRIIAGLAEGTLIVESGSKGGALITAELASSYNREVFAVPGRTNDSHSAGCNRLIKKHLASLVESAEDIEYLLNWEPPEISKKPVRTLRELLTDEERRLLLILQEAPDSGPDILSIRTSIPLPTVISLLLHMELKSWVTSLPGNLYRATVRLEE